MNALGDLARVTTATTGIGPITLGPPVIGFLTFAEAGIADGSTVSYGIADGNQSETGWGLFDAGTLTRNVYRSTGSGNDTPIVLSGAAQVFITALSADFESLAAGAGAGVPEAPADNIGYGRVNLTWVPVLMQANDTLDGGNF